MYWLRELLNDLWEASDLQATIKYFFDTSRNIMVTAAVGLAAELSHSDLLVNIYGVALFFLGWQISISVANWIEKFTKVKIATIGSAILFYALFMLPISIEINIFVKNAVRSIVAAQSNAKSENTKYTKTDNCRFQFALNDFACPDQTGISR